VARERILNLTAFFKRTYHNITLKPPISSKQRFAHFRRSPARDEPDVSMPGEDGQPRPAPADRRKYLRDYVRWLWPYRRGLVSVLLLALITAALDMIWPLAIKGAIDLLPRDLPVQTKSYRLHLLGATVLGLLVLKQAIDTFRGYRIAALNATVIFRLRERLFEKLLLLPLDTLGEMKSGGIVARLSGDVDSVSGLVQQAIISPAVATIRIILSVSILLWLSWRLP